MWRLRSPSVSLRGAAVRAVACPERDARVFRPRSREAGPSRGTAPLEADPEAAHSLRPSAGGARVGTAPRARAVAPRRRRDGLLKPSCLRRGARTRSFQSRVSAREIRDPRAFHGAVALDLGPTGSPVASIEGYALILRSGHTLITLAAKRNDPRPRPGQRPSTSLDDAPRRASRPASVAASRCLDSASTTNVHVTSTRYRHHLWRLPASRGERAHCAGFEADPRRR